MPLTPPDPPLADDEIRLVPLTPAHVSAMLALTADPDVVSFTRAPAGADEAFARGWIQRYEDGWTDGSKAGFAITAPDGAFLGFAAIVDLALEKREGEIGYMVAPAARGRGIAPRAVELLTRWAFDGLELLRIELLIDVRNAASETVAQRSGYRQDGILRNVHFKGDLRCDLGIWSRLSQD